MTVFPETVFSVPSLSVPAAAPNAVDSVPEKVPATPSVSVTDSLSPVSSFTTVTVTVPSPARSASVTEMFSKSPGLLVGLMVTVPLLPPPTVSVAVSAAVAPVLVSASL